MHAIALEFDRRSSVRDLHFGIDKCAATNRMKNHKSDREGYQVSMEKPTKNTQNMEWDTTTLLPVSLTQQPTTTTIATKSDGRAVEISIQ